MKNWRFGSYCWSFLYEKLFIGAFAINDLPHWQHRFSLHNPIHLFSMIFFSNRGVFIDGLVRFSCSAANLRAPLIHHLNFSHTKISCECVYGVVILFATNFRYFHFSFCLSLSLSFHLYLSLQATFFPIQLPCFVLISVTNGRCAKIRCILNI